MVPSCVPFQWQKTKQMKTDIAQRAGFTGGMAATFFANIFSYELLKTALLAAVGTAVSFGMTKLLQRLLQIYLRKYLYIQIDITLVYLC